MALVCLSSLLCFAALAVAQEKAAAPQKGDAPAKTGQKAAPDAGKMSAGKGKDDLDATIDEKLKAKKKKEEAKPNLELRTVKTAPFDLAVPYFKQNHWTLFQLELIANNGKEDIEVRTGYARVPDSPHELRYRRFVHLEKEEERRVRIPMLLPHTYNPKEIELGLHHPDAVLPISPPGLERQPCTKLEPHQFLIVVFSPDPDKYNFLNGFQCVQSDIEPEDFGRGDRRRYYHVVRPGAPNRPPVADTVQGWTTTSFAIWDDLDPELLTASQKDALKDWLHWGGQLIVSGGAAATKLEQSFLAPYLPADVMAESGSIPDMSDIAIEYRPPPGARPSDAKESVLRIKPTEPIYAAKLAPRPGSRIVRTKSGKPLVTQDGLPLMVERDVGRGRVVMSAFSLYQREFVQWADGYDTFWRLAIMKLPDVRMGPMSEPGGNRVFMATPPSALTRVRYLARDLGAGPRTTTLPPGGADDDGTGLSFGAYLPQGYEAQKVETVAEWRDDTLVPSVARQTLLDATGISIPPPSFVLWAAVSFVVILVPVNWLVCRIALGRPEWAWLAAPLIVLAFAVGIVRLAEKNVGFDVVRREVDVVEAYADYPRAHLTRFTCVYSGSRRRLEFRYDNSQAVAMPMAMGTVQRGQNVERLGLDFDMHAGAPVVLGRYEIHPRSIGMVRAEEMLNVPDSGQARGPGSSAPGFRFEHDPATGKGVVVNQTGWDLWDCHVVAGAERIRVGDLRPGEKLDIAPAADAPEPEASGPADGGLHRLPATERGMLGHSTVAELGDLSPLKMMAVLERESIGPGTRLIGWMPRPLPGQEIDPNPGLPLGFTVCVVHLDAGGELQSSSAQAGSQFPVRNAPPGGGPLPTPSKKSRR